MKNQNYQIENSEFIEGHVCEYTVYIAYRKEAILCYKRLLPLLQKATDRNDNLQMHND